MRQQLLAQGLAAGAEAAAVGCELAAAERVILRGATHDLPWPARRLWGIGKAFPRLQAGGVSKSACLQSLLQLCGLRMLLSVPAPGFPALQLGSWLAGGEPCVAIVVHTCTACTASRPGADMGRGQLFEQLQRVCELATEISAEHGRSIKHL